jgi:electron transport complex protein RnfC
MTKICFVTVAGDGVQYSSTVAAPCGTPVKKLFEECMVKLKNQKIILGSVMSGRAIESTDVGIEENTKSVILLNNYSVRTDLNCIGCSRCVSVCPQRLSPYYIYKSSKRGINDDALKTLAKYCTDCGCCSYVCPGKCNPAHYIRLYKRRSNLNTGGETLETDTNRV